MIPELLVIILWINVQFTYGFPTYETQRSSEIVIKLPIIVRFEEKVVPIKYEKYYLNEKPNQRIRRDNNNQNNIMNRSNNVSFVPLLEEDQISSSQHSDKTISVVHVSTSIEKYNPNNNKNNDIEKEENNINKKMIDFEGSYEFMKPINEIPKNNFNQLDNNNNNKSDFPREPKAGVGDIFVTTTNDFYKNTSSEQTTFMDYWDTTTTYPEEASTTDSITYDRRNRNRRPSYELPRTIFQQIYSTPSRVIDRSSGIYGYIMGNQRLYDDSSRNNGQLRHRELKPKLRKESIHGQNEQGEPKQVYSGSGTSQGQPEQVYGEPERIHGQPEQVYGQPESVHGQPEQVYSEPATNHGKPEQVYGQSERIHGQPEQVYSEPATNHGQPEQVYGEPERIHGQPEQVYGQPERVHGQPEQVYNKSQQDQQTQVYRDLYQQQQSEGNKDQVQKMYEESEKVFDEPQRVHWKPSKTVYNRYEYENKPIEMFDDDADSTYYERNYETSEYSHTEPIFDDVMKTQSTKSTTYPFTNKDSKSTYIMENGNYKKYRIEEKTSDGFIVGEYGVVSHHDGSLRGVRYTADSNINPAIIYQTLIKFLSLK